MTSSLNVSINGIELTLFAERAAYAEQHRALFIADTHFGKDATFRRHGLPVPVGSSEQTLRTVDKLLNETSARRLVILGDLFHARSSLSQGVQRSLDAFFAQHASVEFVLVRGNHDKHLISLPTGWPIEIVEPGARIEGIVLSHEPMQVPDDADAVLCGHLHPAIRFVNASESLGKLPCFWLSQGCLVLPAIGVFTGTHAIRMKDDDRAWVVVEDEIIEAQHHRC